MTAKRGKEVPRSVIVKDREHGLPYSKGLTANTIIASGLPPLRAYQVAQVIEERLRDRKSPTVSVAELRKITIAAIREEAGDRYAESYQKWTTVGNLDIPLIILIGGATGVGKSTIATQLAARLSIPRVISTDAIREVMKSSFSKEFMPTLFTSSFAAAEVVAAKAPRSDDAVLIGFRDQVAAVSVGVHALIERAVLEGTDIIIEGAHLVPGFIHPETAAKRAVIVHLVVQVEDEDLHRSHFFVRATDSRQRPAQRYLVYFDNIRRIQKYFKSLALQHGVPIINNYNLDAALRAVIDQVIEKGVEAADRRPTRRRTTKTQQGATT